MKRIIALVLCVLLATTLAACGGKQAGDNSSINGGTGSTNSTDDGGKTENTVNTADSFADLKAIFANKTFIDVAGKSTDPKTHIVKMEDSDMYWRYATVEANKKGNTVIFFTLQISTL